MIVCFFLSTKFFICHATDPFTVFWHLFISLSRFQNYFWHETNFFMDESVRYQLKDLSNDDIIPVSKDQFRIGRTTSNFYIDTWYSNDSFWSSLLLVANDLSYVNNRYVSGNHCLLEFVEGQLYISDTSSNGTLINRSIKVMKNASVNSYQNFKNNIIETDWRLFSAFSWNQAMLFTWSFEEIRKKIVCDKWS